MACTVTSHFLKPKFPRSKYVLIYLKQSKYTYEGWNFNSGNYLFTTDTK